MTLSDDVGRTVIEDLIHEWIVGKNAERDRLILKRRLIDGVCYEPLAEEFDLSVPQIKRITQKGIEKLYKHIRTD